MKTMTFSLDANEFTRRVDEVRLFALNITSRYAPAVAARLLLRTATLTDRAIEGFNDIKDDDEMPRAIFAAAFVWGLAGPCEPLTPFAMGLRAAAQELKAIKPRSKHNRR